MKKLRKLFSRRTSSATSTNISRNRLAKTMPGESAAMESVRLGCMSL